MKLQHRAGNNAQSSSGWAQRDTVRESLLSASLSAVHKSKERTNCFNPARPRAQTPQKCAHTKGIFSVTAWPQLCGHALKKTDSQSQVSSNCCSLSRTSLVAKGEQFAALEDHKGFLRMARNVLTGDLQLISNALQSIFGRVFLFCFLTTTQLKKKQTNVLNWCTGWFSFSVRALVFRVRICASTLAKIFMAELGKRVKVKRQAVGPNKDQNH